MRTSSLGYHTMLIKQIRSVTGGREKQDLTTAGPSLSSTTGRTALAPCTAITPGAAAACIHNGMSEFTRHSSEQHHTPIGLTAE